MARVLRSGMRGSLRGKAEAGRRGRQHADAQPASAQALGEGHVLLPWKSVLARPPLPRIPRASPHRGACGPRWTKGFTSGHPQGAAAPRAFTQRPWRQVTAPAHRCLPPPPGLPHSSCPSVSTETTPAGEPPTQRWPDGCPPPTRTASVSPEAGTPTSCTTAFPCPRSVLPEQGCKESQNLANLPSPGGAQPLMRPCSAGQAPAGAPVGGGEGGYFPCTPGTVTLTSQRVDQRRVK